MQSDQSASPSLHNHVSKLSKAAFNILLVTTILTPLVFWPSPYIALDLIKVIVIAFGTITSAILLFISARKDRTIHLPPRNILWIGIFLTLSTIISALLSTNIEKSFFGQGFEFGTASSLLILFVACLVSYVLISQRIQRVVVLYLGIILSYILLFLFQAYYLHFGLTSPFFSFLRNSTSTILGVSGWLSLGTYSLLIAIITILASVFLSLSSRMKLFYWLITIVAFMGACIAYNRDAWQAAAIAFLVLTVFIYINKSKKTNSSETSSMKRFSWLCIIAFLIAAGLFWKGASLLAPVTEYLKVPYTEVGLSWRSTLDISSEIIKEKPFFGTGPNLFSQAYITHKPLDINLTSVWNAEFGFGSGILPTFFVTQGLVGGILWLVFVIVFIFLMIRAFNNLPHESDQRFLVSSLFSGSIFLWIMMFVSTPTHSIIFLTFVFTGASVGAAVYSGIIKSTEIKLNNHNYLAKLISFTPFLLVIVFLVWGVIYIKKAVALAYFGSGIKQLTLKQNPEAALKDFARSLKIDSSDIYWRAEVEALLSKVSLIVQESDKKSTPISKDTVLQITGTINEALSAAQSAVDYDPGNYYNYISKARVFEFAARLKMDGAADGAVQAYLQAINLAPSNPALYLNLARLQVSQNRLDDALQSVGAAIKTKQNYLDAIFILSQIQAIKGNTKDAIIAAKVATEIDPRDPLSAFQLGLLYYNSKQYALAAESLAKAIELEPSYANAQYFLGLAYYYQNKKNQAIEQFMKIRISNPENQEIALILANLKSGKSPFANINPPASTPEKRSSLPLESDSR